MNIVVVGAGKLGLPLACAFARNGGAVTVTDIQQHIVDAINSGDSPYDEPELQNYVKTEVAAGRLQSSTETTEATRTADAIIIIVSALLTADSDIDYANLAMATRAVARGLQKGAIVSYETTLPVGGCRNHLCPILEESGLIAGKDFHLIFSPERVKSKSIFEKLASIPKIVGGIDSVSAETGCRFYERYLGTETTNVQTLEAAEFMKLAGMIYRDVNIGLANQLAEFAEDANIEIWPILAAANTDGETSLLRPSIGVGGHCTPVYPHFLIREAERRGINLSMAIIGRTVNDQQPFRAVERLSAYLGGLAGKTVHILGLGFRPGVREDAMSPAYQLQDALKKMGAQVTLEDPLFSHLEIAACGFTPSTVGKSKPEAVILNTAHEVFCNPNLETWQKAGVTVIVDGQNMWSKTTAIQAGLGYIGVGFPDPMPPER